MEAGESAAGQGQASQVREAIDTESPTDSDRPFFPNLEALRGIAAVWVLLFHLRFELRSIVGEQYDLVWPWIRGGRYGVDLFFALSGFVITHRYGARLRERGGLARIEFIKRRVWRIWPAYLAALLVALLAVRFAQRTGYPTPPGQFDASSFVRCVAMVQAWTPTVPRTWNVVGWSVSVEWALYLVFPLLVLMKNARARRLGMVCVMGLCVAVLSTLPKPSPMEHGLLRGLLAFTAGALVSEGGERQSGNWGAGLTGLGLLLAFGFAYGHTRGTWLHPLYWVGPYFAIAVGFVAAAPQLRPRNWLCGLGVASYSLYLVHGSAIDGTRALLRVPMSHHMPSEMAWESVGLAAAATAVLTVALHFGVERRWYRRGSDA